MSKLVVAYDSIPSTFNAIKLIAPQLKPSVCWNRVLMIILDKMGIKGSVSDPPQPALLTT